MLIVGSPVIESLSLVVIFEVGREVLSSSMVFAARRRAWGSTLDFCGLVSAIWRASRRERCKYRVAPLRITIVE
jgi:hypothetical protein